MIGSTVSHYKILEKLGGGGMGVVYKAEDTKLKRTVALKFLPPVFSFDQEAKKRFINEAQAASALQQHNICTIHDIDETKDGQIFICMDCYEGETLKKKIERGQIKTDEAIDIIVQVAAGLQKAHEKGIIHRDIKPANIFITNDGVVKILDFGLAKLSGQTMMTKMGETVGTIAYMSPEQTRGELVDNRTDIWSLGVVLYEMLAGNLPFKGDYDSAMIYSILNEEPKPMREVQSGIPESLGNIVSRAMAKRTDDRYSTVAEFLSEMEAYKSHNQVSRTTRRFTTYQRRVRGIVISIAVLIVVSLLSFFLFKHPAVREINPDMSFRELPTPFTQISQPGLSADGNWVAFPVHDGKKLGIYFMNTSGGEPRKITLDSFTIPIRADISPDGSQVVFENVNMESQIEIRIVSSLGSLSRLLVEVGSHARWRNDGNRIGYTRGENQSPSDSRKLEFWTVRPDGNDNRLEFIDTASAGTWQSSFAWSPDGKAIAWIRPMPSGDQTIIIHELAGGREQQLALNRADINDVSWSDGDEIVFSTSTPGSANLWMVRASGGQEIQITRGSGPDEGARISMDGKKLVYLQQRSVGHIWIANIDLSNPYQVTFDDRFIKEAVLSPNGNRIAFSLHEYDSQNHLGSHIYVMNINGTERFQCTSGQELANTPAWSPDEKWIAYCDHFATPDSSRVFLIDASNPGSRKFVAVGTRPWWFRHDQLVVFQGKNTWLVSLGQNAPVRFFLDSTWAYPILDGKYILFYDFHAGMEGWWVVRNLSPDATEYSGRRKICSTEYEIILELHGNFLIYLNPQRRMVKVHLPSGREEQLIFKPEQLRGGRVLPSVNQGIGVNTILSYDSKKFIYTEYLRIGKLILVENPFIWD